MTDQCNSVQVHATHILVLIYTDLSFVSVIMTTMSVSSWRHGVEHDDTMASWMTTHGHTLARRWRQMMTVQTMDLITTLFKQKAAIIKKKQHHFFQGKVHLCSLFWNGKKYLWKKRLNIFFTLRARRVLSTTACNSFNENNNLLKIIF